MRLHIPQKRDFKLIFAKLYDELICANDPTAYLQFRNNGNTDYPIFFATMQKQSKDNSGDKIYVKDPVTGENVLDHHGHLIVDHDLYSHEGLTPDGIAEAFIEFAKKEGITEAKNRELKRSCLHPGDIVVTKTGVYFGKSAVIPESIPEANTIAHVGKITLKSQYNPYYVSTFLKSNFRALNESNVHGTP